MVKVGLYLMTEKGEAVLRAAFKSGIEISHVTTFDATGMNDNSRKVIEMACKMKNVPVFLRGHPPEFTGDWSIAAGWRWMLDVPNLVVIHDSLLPRYRGFSPLITALVNGEPEVGATAFLAREEPDTGPIIVQMSMGVHYPTKMRTVLNRMVPLYFQLATEVLDQLKSDGGVKYAEQDHAGATYALFRDEDDYRIQWNWDDRRIQRLVNAASDPFPGAQTTVNGSPGTIHEVAIEPDVTIEDRQPGKVAFIRDGCPVVVCGRGLLRVTKMDTIFKEIPIKSRFH